MSNVFIISQEDKILLEIYRKDMVLKAMPADFIYLSTDIAYVDKKMFVLLEELFNFEKKEETIEKIKQLAKEYGIIL
jgi:hypothetical protein